MRTEFLIQKSRGNRDKVSDCSQFAIGRKSNFIANSAGNIKNKTVIAYEYRSVFPIILESLSKPSGAIKIGVPPDFPVNPKSPTNALRRPSRFETKIFPVLISP